MKADVKDPASFLTQDSATAIKDVFDLYDAYAVKHIKPRTLGAYRDTMRVMGGLLPAMPLKQLTAFYVEDNVLPTLRERFSPWTVQRHMSCMRTIFSWATRRGHAKINPFAGLVPPIPDSSPVLIPDNHIQLIKAYFSRDKEPYWHYTFFNLLLQTGMRKEVECFSLLWSQIDIPNKWAKIIGKGDKLRTVPLNDAALDVLISAQRKLGNDRVFWQPQTISAVNRAWTRAKQRIRTAHRLSKDDFDYRLHDFRSTHAARMLIAGATLEEVMRVHGWNDYKTYQRYQAYGEDFVMRSRNAGQV